VLQTLLSNGYNKRRPVTKAAMAARLEFFRALRRARRPQDPHASAPAVSDVVGRHHHHHHHHHHHDARDGRKAELDAQAQADNVTRSAALAYEGMRMDLDSQYLPEFYADGYGHSIGADEKRRSHVRPVPGASIEPEGQDFAANARLLSERGKRKAQRVEFLKSKLSGQRSSSVIDRIASLLSSNLSLRSASSNCNSITSSSASMLSIKASTSSRTPTRQSSLAPSQTPSSTATQTATQAAGKPLITEEEAAVWDACCFEVTPGPRCVHRRLKDALRSRGRTALTILPREAETVDRLGNTLLHTAADWGASLELLHSLIEQGAKPHTMNRSRETFLHLYRPWKDKTLNADAIFAFVGALERRYFNFGILDGSGMAFYHRWIQAPAMTIDVLVHFLAPLPRYARQSILGDQKKQGVQLRSWIQARQSAGNFLHLFLDPESALGPDGPQQRDAAPPAAEDAEPPLDQKRASFLLPTSRAGWNPLHHLVAAAPRVTPATARDYLAALDRALAAAAPRDLENRELLTQRTPLLTLVATWPTGGGGGSGGGGGGGLGGHELAEAVLARLLARGAQVRVEDAEGRTALHLAALGGGGAAAALALCRAGAEVNAEDKGGATPADLVWRGVVEGGRAGVGGEGGGRLVECGAVLFDYGGRGGRDADLDFDEWFDWVKYSRSEDGRRAVQI
jgi:ankyrin repeat protein